MVPREGRPRVPLRWRQDPLALAEYVLGKELGPADEDGALREVFHDVEAFFAPTIDAPTLLDLFDDANLLGSTFGSVDQAVRQALKTVPKDFQSAYHRMLDRLGAVVGDVVPLLASVSSTPAHVASPFGANGEYQYPQTAGQLGDASYDEPIQGIWNTCSLVSAMVAVAWASDTADDWNLRLGSTGFSSAVQPWHRWHFFDFDRPAKQTVTLPTLEVEEDLPVNRKNGSAMHSRARTGELWPAFVEKAWVMQSAGMVSDRGTNPSFQQFQAVNNFGDPSDGIVALVGGSPDLQYDNGPGQLTDLLTKGLYTKPRLLSAMGVAEIPICAWTPASARRKDLHRGYRIKAQHAYAVLGIMRLDDEDHIVLRDPRPRRFGVRRAALPDWEAARANGSRTIIPINMDSGVGILPLSVFGEIFEGLGWCRT
ncbi:MAG: hypothetical protein ING40_10685 [Burkholderiales bacterium]|jgi:hypothetical protein|nr:hypothetical protein [Burkholderiales bacterium]MCA3229488.1 hypothetical protein [Burkholderiales bacterium]